MIDTKVSDIEFSRDVVSVDPNCSLVDALNLMNANKVGSLIITEQDQAIGIFTERDVLTKIVGMTVEELKTPISQFMSPNPISVGPSDDIALVFRHMRDGGFRHVVVQSDGRLEGVISVKDLLDVLNQTITSLQNSLASLLKNSAF